MYSQCSIEFISKRICDEAKIHHLIVYNEGVKGNKASEIPERSEISLFIPQFPSCMNAFESDNLWMTGRNHTCSTDFLRRENSMILVVILLIPVAVICELLKMTK